jgi:transposase, IS30 family
MGVQYKHLSETDRLLIENGKLSGLSFAAIGRLINRSTSTVARECKRGHWKGFDRYMALFGQRHYEAGRRNAGLLRRKLGADLDSSMWQLVRQGLSLHWSPEQIAGRIRTRDPLLVCPMAAPLYVSHETIYRAIYDMPRCALRTELVQQLRQSRSGRRRRSRGKQRFVGLQDFTPIALRPPHIQQRLQPGHWEGDLIKGARATPGVVATLVERNSRLLRLVKLSDASADALMLGLTERLGNEPPWMLRSLTYDRGTEMARHKALAQALKIDIYICDPYSPWQRGANENANGLIRQYLPKGMDLSQVSQEQLLAIEYLLNNRPRRVLGYKTPQEVFNALQAAYRPS